MIKLGFARKDITPDFSVPMAGYYLKNRISQGVHDKLYVRALFFEGAEGGPIVILQFDLLQLDQICMEKIYEKLKGGLDKNRLLVCATHTHSGFGGIFDTEQGINHDLIPMLGEFNSALVDLVVKQSMAVIDEASRNCVETTVSISRGTVDGLATNRRREDLPSDKSLFVMEFCRSDGKKILLYNLCCHPTVLDRDNLLLSADFPGVVAGKLEGNPSGYDMVVFANGSAGDMSTRFTRRESTFNECDRFAKIVIDALAGLEKGKFLPLEKVGLSYHSVSLHLTEPSDPQNARISLQNAVERFEELKRQNADTATLRKAASLVEGAQMNLLKSGLEEDQSKPDTKADETGVLTINDTVIVCSPFELFSTLALVLKKSKGVECFSYINCLASYLADCDAWDNLDYEALTCGFARGEGERYIELVSAIL